MSMPKISDINPNINITREEAVNIIIASVAMEELALAHILNAEGEKLQYVLGTLEGSNPDDEITICDIMAVNKSMQKTLRDVIKEEMLLEFKLEDAIELVESEDECQLTVKGQKIWRDGNNVAGKRPAAVEIKLLRDGIDINKTVNVDSKGDGRFTFTCLPKYNSSGQKYTYTVDETTVPGYKKTVDGFNITNTIEPGTITINVTKYWDDDQITDRPANITVNLFRNGSQIQSKTVASGDQDETLINFDAVPQFDDEGKPFVYTVAENAIPLYKTEIDGYYITNTHE